MDGNREYSHNTKANTYEENGIAERVSVKQLQRLVHLLDGSDVSEIEVKCADTGMRLALRKRKRICRQELVATRFPLCLQQVQRV